MNNIFAAFVIFYLLNGIVYLYAIIRLIIKEKSDGTVEFLPKPFVSVIVPARNEARTIIKCIDCLINQEYPDGQYEIIPVNDASTDGTEELIDNIAENNRKVRPVHIAYHSRENKGKINAINQGIQHAKGEIIITTDADIWMEPGWLNQMVACFDKETGLVIGLTLDKYSNHPVHAFQALDGAGIRIIAAGLAEINKPITCQGSNLAFRKNAYMEVQERVLSLGTTCGNREWLMQEIDMNTDWGINTQLHPQSIAHTNSPNTWKALINQRARWASTGKNYSRLSVRLYLVLIYFSLLSFILVPWLLPLKICAMVFGLKFLIDFSVALAVIQVIQKPRFLFAFPLVFFIQPVMVVITAFLGTFGLYRWK